MTLPLLVGTDGKRKMSKSYGNHIALNDEPKAMFGKLMSVPDEAMWQYFELLTGEDLKDLKKMHPKEAKARLAFQITERYHGGQNAQASKEEFEKVFAKKDLPDIVVEHSASRNKMFLSHLLYEAGLSPSKNESRRLIENGGVRMDGKQVRSDGEIEIRGPIILQVGRRKFKKIVFKNASRDDPSHLSS
jgi:tyrosyl-tRNA synthetase